MEELGPELAGLSSCFGPLAKASRAHVDRLLVMGTQAAAVCAGLAEGGGRGEAVESLEAVASVVAQWRGAVFIKGSRRYRLETVLPAAA
jgi:UDP-N-acetylmuramoyl-tripeptide--D-alanyl-D-alanine ligase